MSLPGTFPMPRVTRSTPAGLTRELAVARHGLGHEAASPVQTHHVGDLLLALFAAGPGQRRQGVFPRDFALGGEAVLGGLGSPLHAARVTLLEDGQLGLPAQLRQVPAAGGVRRGRQPPSRFVPGRDGSHHLGHHGPGAVRPAPPSAMLPAGAAPAPSRAVQVLGAIAALRKPSFFLPILLHVHVDAEKRTESINSGLLPPSSFSTLIGASLFPVPTERNAAAWQLLQEQPLCSKGHYTAPSPPKTPG